MREKAKNLFILVGGEKLLRERERERSGEIVFGVSK